jgi:hypothetical protein
MNEENTKQSPLTQDILNLIDAIEGVQDWSGTYVGDCIDAVLISLNLDTSS